MISFYSDQEAKYSDLIFREQDGPGSGHDRGRGSERNAIASDHRSPLAHSIVKCNRGVRGRRGNKLDERDYQKE